MIKAKGHSDAGSSVAALAIAMSMAFPAVAQKPATQPSVSDPRGRWVTESGNLEVEIVPCGAALCGVVTKVLGNKSMSREGAEMAPADIRPPLGMVLLRHFVRSDDGEATSPAATWSGEIYNRENGKTYDCVMSVSTAAKPAGELVLRAYVGIPLFGKTQRWQRVNAQPVAALHPASQAAPASQGPDAPDFTGIDQWFNSPALRMAQLRGKVVLVDFWTHGCGNCINTLPALKRWHSLYKDKGLVIVGVHTPEFAMEADGARVQAAIQRFGINYPVALDNNYRTWTAWHNVYWPAQYLVDKSGHVVFQHQGEGDEEAIEAQIQAALRAP
jgi:uncharacterized protein (DUF2147 family)/glutathione peroxidase-family protein